MTRRILTLCWIAWLLLGNPWSAWAGDQPILSDLSQLVRGSETWYVAVGTTLYASADLNSWKVVGEATGRIRTLKTHGAAVAAGGRDFVTTYDSRSEKAITTEVTGDVVDLYYGENGWVALDSVGKVLVQNATGTWDVAKVGEAKLSRLVRMRLGVWIAVGSAAGEGKVFEASTPNGPWKAIPVPGAPLLQNLATWDRVAIAISNNGRVLRRSVQGAWESDPASTPFGDEAPQRLLASEDSGFYASVGDGIVHSWDGLTWFRCAYHDFKDTRPYLVLAGDRPTVVSMAEDPSHPSATTGAVERYIDRERPAIAAMDLPRENRFAMALGTWDEALSAAQQPSEALNATRAFVQAIGTSSVKPSAEESSRWVQRLQVRLGKFLQGKEALAQFRGDLASSLGNVEVVPPAPLTVESDGPEPEKEPTIPPLAPLPALRQRASAGNLGAMLDLAIAYLHGAGVREDREASAFWLQWAHESDPGVPSLADLERNDLSVASLRKLATNGSIWAALLLADHLREGSDTDMDLSAAAEGYRQAALGGSQDALAALGELYLSGWGVERNPEAAVALLIEPAKARNPTALYNMGRCYEMGAGVAEDHSRAAECFRSAAEMGDRRSIRKFADILWAGRGCPRDPEQAKQWLAHAAENGDREAARRFDLMEAGSYVAAGPETEASHARHPALFNWTTREAEARQGNAGACWDLAEAAAGGFGMYPNSRYASFWLGRAITAGMNAQTARTPEPLAPATLRDLSKAGSLHALFRLAEHELFDETGKIEHELGLNNLREAAQRGHFTAQGRLGEWLLGSGTPEARGEGLKWLEKGAANGDPFSEYKLGTLCAVGKDVTLDPARAIALYRKAALKGLRQAQVDLAFLIATGQARGTALPEASAWFLALAGLPAKTVSPEAAEALIEAESRARPGPARGIYAVLLKLGFGTRADPVKAAAWSLLAEDTQSNLYDLGWYAEGADVKDVAAAVQQLRAGTAP